MASTIADTGTRPKDTVATQASETATTQVEASMNTPLALITPEPWSDPVDGRTMLAEMETILRRHTVMTDHERLAVALWSVNSHCHDISAHSPYLAIQSPVKRCGKTTVLGIIKAFVLRPFGATSVTAASLFRLINDQSPTVLIDEMHLVIETSRSLRELLDAAHNRNTAKVVRTINNQPVVFNVFGPKVLACIGHLPGTISDRAIVINLRRRKSGEIIETAPQCPEVTYQDATRRIARWVRDNTKDIMDAVPAIPTGLNDRAADNWRPLLAIAASIGTDVYERACSAAIAICLRADEESVDLPERLLRNIRTILDEQPKPNVFTVAQLHAHLLQIDDGFWSEFKQGQPLTKTKLAVMLSPFGIRSASRRTGPTKKVHRTYHREDFSDVIARYCPHEEA